MMKDSLIRDYFRDQIGAPSLRLFLSPLRGSSELINGGNIEFDLDQDYHVKIDDVRAICSDYLSGNFNEADVVAIAFIIMGSDHFVWDKSTTEGAVIADLIGDWSSPEAAFPINKSNLSIILNGLESGVYDTEALLKANHRV